MRLTQQKPRHRLLRARTGTSCTLMLVMAERYCGIRSVALSSGWQPRLCRWRTFWCRQSRTNLSLRRSPRLLAQVILQVATKLQRGLQAFWKMKKNAVGGSGRIIFAGRGWASGLEIFGRRWGRSGIFEVGEKFLKKRVLEAGRD